MRQDTTHRLIAARNRLAAVSVAAALVLAGTGCSRRTERTKDAASDSMSAVKGMALDTAKRSTVPDTSSITFTAAQIEHGKIRWAPVALGQSSTSAVIP